MREYTSLYSYMENGIHYVELIEHCLHEKARIIETDVCGVWFCPDCEKAYPVEDN